jgi:hypothetical protein
MISLRGPNPSSAPRSSVHYTERGVDVSNDDSFNENDLLVRRFYGKIVAKYNLLNVLK